MVSEEFAVETQLDGAAVESDTEVDTDLNFAMLKEMAAEMPAEQQGNVSELVESLTEEDLSTDCIFLKDFFRMYFESLDQIARTISPLENLQKVWLKVEALNLLSKYMELKKFMKGIGIHIQDPSPKEQMQLCVARLSVDD